jgi:hypothetical protein
MNQGGLDFIKESTGVDLGTVSSLKEQLKEQQEFNNVFQA